MLTAPNPRDRTFLESAFAERGLHHATDGVPPFRTDLGMSSTIGDDLDAPIREQQINENSVVPLRVPDLHGPRVDELAAAALQITDAVGASGRKKSRRSEAPTGAA